MLHIKKQNTSLLDNPNKINLVLYYVLTVLAAVVLAVSGILFTILFQYDIKTNRVGNLNPIEITGEYSEENGPFKPFTSRTKTNFDNTALRDITVRGHFSRDLPKGSPFYLNIDHMWVSLRINGEEIFGLKPAKGDGNPTKATGKQWVKIVSPGITTTDFVELRFGNLYWNAYMIQFDELLRQMYTGDEWLMFFKAIQLTGWTMGVGTIFLFLTLFLLMVSFGCFILRIIRARQILWLGLTALFSAIWFYTLSPALTLILPLPVFLNVLYSISMQGIAVFFILFISEHLKGWRRQSMLGCVGMLMVLILVSLINQIFSIQDLYSAINWFSVVDFIILFFVIFCLCYELHVIKNKDIIQLVKAMIPLGIFSALELINGFVQFAEAAIMLGFGLIIFTMYEGIGILRRIKQSMENEKRFLKLENELNQSRISVMLSQVQPHFLYNSLVGIKQLCDNDPKRASEALEHFSYYLRSNLNSLVETQLIPFVKEMEHVRDYLYLEKMRFSNKLHIIIDLEYEDFMLPSLTVQPIVENAVRYGIVRKKGGGTLTIKSERNNENVYIIVSDNGVGFDPEKQPEDGQTHIGIKNVSDRLRLQCKGTLSMDSEMGAGTTVKITLPQKEGAH